MREAERLLVAATVADDDEVVLGIQDHAEPGPHDGVVVDEQHPYAHARTAAVTAPSRRDPSLVPDADGTRTRTRKPPRGRGPASIVPPEEAARSRMEVLPEYGPEHQRGDGCWCRPWRDPGQPSIRVHRAPPS